jgi:hypothetical protein
MKNFIWKSKSKTKKTFRGGTNSYKNITKTDDTIIYLDPMKNTNVWGSVFYHLTNLPLKFVPEQKKFTTL